jgi:hypothetical protein
MIPCREFICTDYVAPAVEITEKYIKNKAVLKQVSMNMVNDKMLVLCF